MAALGEELAQCLECLLQAILLHGREDNMLEPRVLLTRTFGPVGVSRSGSMGTRVNRTAPARKECSGFGDRGTSSPAIPADTARRPPGAAVQTRSSP
jgi:hypothetical protein